MRKFLVLLGLLGILAILLTGPVIAQTRSVFWERWDVVIDNVDTTNNSFDVSEQYDVFFTGTFRFGSAVIPSENLEQIRNIQVSEAGAPMQESCSERPGTFCVRQVQEGTSIVYYFNSPITDGRQIFEIEYTVDGALRVYEGGDQLSWAAIPEDHFGFSIGSSQIIINMPQGYGPREGIDPVETYGAPGEISVVGTQVRAVATREIGGNEMFAIRMQYPHDPNARMAAWQPAFDQSRAFEDNVKPILDLVLMVIGVVLAIAGPLGVYYLWHSRGRDPKVGPVPEFLSEPPSNLSPAIVGSLVDEKAELRDVLSTLIDLAHRGYIVIEESRTEGIFGIGGSSEFVFKRTDLPIDDLLSFEQAFMHTIFIGDNLERSMESLKNKFYKHIPSLQNDLYDEMVKLGFFKANPNTTRQIWTGIAMAILVVAGGLGVLAFNAMDSLSASLLCIPIAVGITGLAMLLIGSHMPAKTRKGAEHAAKWNAFREFLVNLEKYQSVENVADKFDAYLPYAVAFGLDRSWVRKFTRTEAYVPIPTWYFPRYIGGPYSRGYRPGTPIGGGLPSASDVMPGELASAGGSGGFGDVAGDLSTGLESISSGLTDMLNSASRTLTSKPQSSNSGSWGSGGSSWSGGGMGGGGFSGGGSRGFG